METDRLWKTILGELELEIAKPTFKTFFSSTVLVDYKESVATIACVNPLTATTIETRYYALIKQRLDRATNQNNSLVFIVNPKATPTKARRSEEELPLFPQSEAAFADHQSMLIKKARLNPLYTFDNFAVSGSNQMAYAAATAVAKSPGTAYNPLFLWGGVGVGKTHLMHGIGHAVLGRKPKAQVISVMGEEFTNEIIDAIQTKTTKQFKQRYRSADLLFIDDIQFIAGKNAVQEEFFHTFNAIHRVGGQIVLTSDRPPHEINKLEDRLRSRFEGGLTIDISTPDFELRSAILRIKAQQKGIIMPMDVAQLIAANITDTRKLEGTLVRLLTEAQTNKLPITLELAGKILGKQEDFHNKKKTTIPPIEVMKTVASFYGLKESQLKGSKRERTIVIPRQILMYILRSEFQINYEDIGDLLGGRDHTTVMHGVDKITHELLINNKLQEDISGIKKRLYG